MTRSNNLSDRTTVTLTAWQVLSIVAGVAGIVFAGMTALDYRIAGHIRSALYGNWTVEMMSEYNSDLIVANPILVVPNPRRIYVEQLKQEQP